MARKLLEDIAQGLREYADSLEAYALELGEEEEPEMEEEISEEAPPPTSKSSSSKGGGDKMSIALSAMKKGMSEY